MLGESFNIDSVVNQKDESILDDARALHERLFPRETYSEVCFYCCMLRWRGCGNTSAVVCAGQSQ